MGTYAQIINVGLILAMSFLSITIFFCLVRTLKGPRLTDRVVAINMINVKVMILIVLIATYMKLNYLVDVAIVYALLSFLSVIVFANYVLQFKINKGKKSKRVKKMIVGDQNGIS